MTAHMAEGEPSEFRSTMRERALAAAEEQLVAGGWESVRVGAVASAAGVSRPTIYAEFGNKDGLGLALVLRETDRFLDGIDARLSRHVDDPVKAMRTAIAYALSESRRSPILRTVLTTTNHQSDSFLPLLTTRSEPLLQRVTEVIAIWWQRSFPHAYFERTPESIEMIVRVVVSHVMMPGSSARKLPDRITRMASAVLREELLAISR